MKSWTKRVIVIAGAAVLSFAAISISCAKTPVSGSAKTVTSKIVNGDSSTAYAETRSQIVPADSLKIVEALQNSFRAISDGVLPSVVEVDVTETKTVQTIDPFEDFRKFFGLPGMDDDSDKNKKGRTREYETKGLGSGVIVRRTGNVLYVLTNNHVAGNASKISVKLNDGREFEGKLVGADSRMDIALVSFETKDKSIPVAILGDSDAVKTGDICLAMGAPLGYSQSVTQGIVSAKGRSGSGIGNINDFIQTDAAINQGNSGGPLVNIYGEVIGINTWIASQSGGSQGLGFSIPINNIKNAIESIISKGKVVSGWLGVSLQSNLTPEYKESLGIKDYEGGLVVQVFVDSPAYNGGIVPGDFIVEIDGNKVKSIDEVQRYVSRLEAGRTATFSVIRAGEKRNLSVKIEERTEKLENGKLWPGFVAVPLTEEVIKELEIEGKVKGVAVTNVIAKSPAAALRLQSGDVITAVNGKPVKDLKEFYSELANVGKSINFDIYSNGGTITTGTYKF